MLLEDDASLTMSGEIGEVLQCNQLWEHDPTSFELGYVRQHAPYERGLPGSHPTMSSARVRITAIAG